RRVRADARALVRAPARTGARDGPDLEPHGLPAPALAARGDLSEGALRRGLPRDACRARVRPGGAERDPPRPRRPAPEVAACLRDRLGPADGRAPDHPRTGGLHDYQAFLHEAGHALHYAGCDPSLPYTFRNL